MVGPGFGRSKNFTAFGREMVGFPFFWPLRWLVGRGGPPLNIYDTKGILESQIFLIDFKTVIIFAAVKTHGDKFERALS